MKRIAADTDLAPQDPTFSADVIRWQKMHGRHALPWQNTRDAYRIWLSEIMLQQTQVAAVIPYYQRFLERFPTVAMLAAASNEAVMAHWSGLGYYSRARNLHRCAQRVVAEYGGVFPADPALLADLPGIGRSTAAAISAFAYGTRAAILDGNVKRVFCRVFGIDRTTRVFGPAASSNAEIVTPAAIDNNRSAPAAAASAQAAGTSCGFTAMSAARQAGMTSVTVTSGYRSANTEPGPSPGSTKVGSAG